MRFTLIISLLLSILAVIFALQNPGFIEVTLFGLGYEGSKALVLILTFTVGVIVGVLGTLPGYIRNRRKVNSLRKTIAEREDEVRREKKKTTKTTRTETTKPETPSTSETETTETEQRDESSSSSPSTT